MGQSKFIVTRIRCDLELSQDFIFYIVPLSGCTCDQLNIHSDKGVELMDMIPSLFLAKKCDFSESILLVMIIVCKKR